MLIGWKTGSCCGHGGHVIESICHIGVAEVSGAPVAPFLLKALDALIADLLWLYYFQAHLLLKDVFIVVHFELNMIKKCNSVTVTMHDYCLPTTP